MNTRQSVAVQRDGASRLAPKYQLEHSGNAFLSYFCPKKGRNLVEKYLRKNLQKFKTYFEDYLEGFPKIPAQPKVSFVVSPGMNFWAIFAEKNSHNSGENDHNGKKIKLVVKTIYKKAFRKYQLNPTFPNVLGLQEWIFEPFLLKNSHNSAENDHNGKKKKLVLKTIY